VSRQQHRFHGDPERFEVLADFINQRYGNTIKYIADIAGGQGMLSRILTKRFNYACETIDPRGHALKGVAQRAEVFDPSAAAYYDLIVGLHPDEATVAVAASALVRPTILIPCCNYWSADKLGRDALVDAIGAYYTRQGIGYERVIFPFKGPKNVGLISIPPGR
jgi:hypothetical protein